MIYPLVRESSINRQRELLIAEDFSRKHFGENCEVILGNDELGVPDAFVFNNEQLLACVELVGYILGKINEIKSLTQIGEFSFSVDVEKCTEVHSRQEHPYTLIRKKIFGERQYQRYEAKHLILLIHTEVYVKNDSLCFAMDGMMQMNPSINNFMHHKNEIIEELKDSVSQSQPNQWDNVYIADYSYSPVVEQCPLIEV